MTFLVISQRARANASYSLKDLPGHGRFDVVVRCILAGTRKLGESPGQRVYCYLKGSLPHGWLAIDPDFVTSDDDEISLAAKLKSNWGDVFTEGSLIQLVKLLPKPFVFLSKDGEESNNFRGTVVLGAQRDLTAEDIAILPINRRISLGKRSLLASHAIIYTRQLSL